PSHTPTLSLHDALPICLGLVVPPLALPAEFDSLRVLLRHPLGVGFGELLRRDGRLFRASRGGDGEGDGLGGFELLTAREEFTEPPQPVRRALRFHPLAPLAGGTGGVACVEVAPRCGGG